jgi:predicted nucleic acid-binding protein
MNWVLDCSVALAWALPDETSKRAERFLADLDQETTLWVPALWWYELANALTMAHRRRRLTESDAVQLVELYGTLPIQTDTHLNSDAVWRFQALAKEHSLSAYDAAYLELAQRKGTGLATLDKPLTKAARKAGVHVLHL